MTTPAQDRNRALRLIAVGTAVVLLGAGLQLGVYHLTRTQPVYGRRLGLAEEDAARACRAALESEAQRLARSAVDTTDPVWVAGSHTWTVDGTLRYARTHPGDPGGVAVRCTAGRSSGGRTVTSIAAS